MPHIEQYGVHSLTLVGEFFIDISNPTSINKKQRVQ
jgi:hypothetical protein